MTEMVFVWELLFSSVITLLCFIIMNRRIDGLKKIIDLATSENKQIEQSVTAKVFEARLEFSKAYEKATAIDKQLRHETNNAECLVTTMHSLIVKIGLLAERLARLKNLCDTDNPYAHRDDRNRGKAAVVEFPKVAKNSLHDTPQITPSRFARSRHSFLKRNLSELLRGVR